MSCKIRSEKVSPLADSVGTDNDAVSHPVVLDSAAIVAMTKRFLDLETPLAERMRLLFTFRNIGGRESISALAHALTNPSDGSCLLKHDICYALGQMGDLTASPLLRSTLSDECEDAMVRHEAAEALAALGDLDSLPILQQFSSHSNQVLAETCRIAVARLRSIQSSHNSTGSSNNSSIGMRNPFLSVDPALPTPELAAMSVDQLSSVLMNENVDLYQRYSAMFVLRNISGNSMDLRDVAVLALCRGLKDSSALFRHEIAYVLGQIQHPLSIPYLSEALANHEDLPMVRHEAAEAIGSVGDVSGQDNIQSETVLKAYVDDESRVVRESCVVALDIAEYYSSDQFQYANGLKQ